VTPKKLFTLFATAEAFTWSFLIAALVIRYFGDPIPHIVTVAGSIHGAVFLGYAVTAVLVGINQRWKIGRLFAGVSLAIVPFATIPFERRLAKEEALEGSWRTTPSDDPRDGEVIDRLFRWFIARPLVLLLLLLVLLPAIFAFLLFLGPPNTWFN
jgi:integral membrane protein